MSESSMKGIFFIIKGDYRKTEPHFTNSVSGDVNYIGGYDPYNSATKEWYMLLDNINFKCIACGSDFNKVLKGVYNNIKTYKGNYKKYAKSILGDFKPAPTMQCLYQQIYKEYGDFYIDEVQEMEDLAFSEIKEETPLNKTRKIISKGKAKLKKVVATPKDEVEIDTTTPNLVAKPRVKIGVKKLKMD